MSQLDSSDQIEYYYQSINNPPIPSSMKFVLFLLVSIVVIGLGVLGLKYIQ